MKRIGIYIDLENVSHLSYEVNFEQMFNNIFSFYKNNLKDLRQENPHEIQSIR